MSKRSPRVRTITIDTAEPLPSIDLAAADEWRVLVCHGGVPCAHVRLPSPGRGGDALTGEALAPFADPHRARLAFSERLAVRVGATSSPARPRSTSVVVCTHRRPVALKRLLSALTRLDPGADEVIVVDNDPGDRDCRDIVRDAGYRYLRVDRRGLNNARHAGASAARCELVAFLDDDCVPSRRWLAGLGPLFADQAVAAVTGPAPPWSLGAPPQRLREDMASFMHGFERRGADWRTVRAAHAGSVGAGANMIFRRSALAGLQEPFPPELDAGTPTRSGGDLYVIHGVLAAGLRVVYDPATWVFHDHRDDPAGPAETVSAYGYGLSAFLSRVVVEERDPATLIVWRWLWRRWISALLGVMSGRQEREALRLRWLYLRGGIAGPLAWWRAARALGTRNGPIGPPVGSRALPDPATREQTPESTVPPSVSVVVVVDGPPATGCLDALLADGGVELIVVDVNEAPCEMSAATRHLHRPGATAAEARNAGVAEAGCDLLLFWAGDLVAEPGVVTRHRARHDGGEDMVVCGPCLPPLMPRDGLEARLAHLEEHERMAARAETLALTFADLPAANLSVRQATFARVGGFDPALPGMRSDWDWAIRVLRAGVRAAYEPRARARRDAPQRSSPAATGIAAALAEGRADARLLARHPAAVVTTLSATPPPWWASVAGVVIAGAAQTSAGRVLDTLERLRARHAWLVARTVIHRSAYEHGLRRAGGRRIAAVARRLSTIDVELESAAPLPAPSIAAPVLGCRLRGKPVTTVVPAHGQWARGLAEQVTDATLRAWWDRRRGDGWRQLPGARTAALPRPQAIPAGVHLLGAGSWSAAARAVEIADGNVLVSLRGACVGSEWLAVAAPGLSGDRVAAIAGVGLPAGEPAGPLRLRSRPLLPVPYAAVRSAPQCVLLNATACRAVGGPKPWLADLGDHAPLLDLLERLLDAGYVVGELEAPGIDPPGAYGTVRRRNELGRWHAAGALLAHRAMAMGGLRGATWMISRCVLPFVEGLRQHREIGEPTLRRLAGSGAALAAGSARALLTVNPAWPGTARPRGSSDGR